MKRLRGTIYVFHHVRMQEEGQSWRQRENSPFVLGFQLPELFKINACYLQRCFIMVTQMDSAFEHELDLLPCC